MQIPFWHFAFGSTVANLSSVEKISGCSCLCKVMIPYFQNQGIPPGIVLDLDMKAECSAIFPEPCPIPIAIARPLSLFLLADVSQHEVAQRQFRSVRTSPQTAQGGQDGPLSSSTPCHGSRFARALPGAEADSPDGDPSVPTGGGFAGSIRKNCSV